MKNIIGLTLILVVISFSGCKKTTTADCETNNYGVLKISYVPSTLRHVLVATAPNPNQSRRKITDIGVTSDTLHLPPETYSLTIASVDLDGIPNDLQYGSATITQCNETLTSVSF
jgi:hypothetical protein